MIAAVTAFVGTLIFIALLDLVSQEVHARLARLPFLVLKLAARRLPATLRVEIYQQEWLPELHYVIADTQIGPITRLIRGTRFALSIWLRRTGSRTASALQSTDPAALHGFDDIRALPRPARKEFGRRMRRLRELLQCPDATDPRTAERLVGQAAMACEAYIDDRDEPAAMSLVQIARPMARRLRPDSPAAMALGRAHAHALLQLGHYQQAEELLRALSEQAIQILGPDDLRTYRTRQLWYWSLVRLERFEEGEAGLRELAALLANAGLDTPLRLHIQCKLSWTISCQKRPQEAVRSYDTVIAGRSAELSPQHPDTLDARHCKGRVLLHCGNGAAAYDVLRPLAADWSRELGRNHPNTLETRKFLALAGFLARGPRARRRCLRTLRRIERAQTRRHGPDYPNTRDTRQWITTLTQPAQT